MFYSVDLLSKKSALGQIWITAVLNAKVTRKKASLIDLSACCDKIREPEVPIALRLSGILMGGVTRVYSSKVLFLWEDANVLMARIRENFSSSKAEKKATATTDKSRAKFEAVTNAYDFAAMEMPLPDNASLPRDFFRDLSYVELPDVSMTDNSAHRAAREDVTLPDIQPAPLFDENFDEVLPPADFGMDEPGMENAPPPADVDDGPPGPSFSPVADGPDVNAADGEGGAQGGRRRPRPEEDEDGEPEERQKRRQPKRQRRRRSSADALIDEETQLASAVLQSWLHDPSDIIHSGPRRVQEATPKEVLHALMTVPSLYSSIDEGGHVTSGFPPALSGIYNMIANLPRTGGAAEDAEAMGPPDLGEAADGPASPREGPATSGDSVERMRGVRDMTPPFGRDSPREGGLFASDDGVLPRSARSTTPDSGGSQGPNGRNIPREGPTPELGVAPDLDFGMDMDFPETVPEFCTLKSIFTQADTLPETFESEHTQRQQHISRRTARFARHFQTEVFQPGKPSSVSFHSLLSKCNRHQAAVSFAEVLALATRGYLKVHQAAPYAAIEIRQGNH